MGRADFRSARLVEGIAVFIGRGPVPLTFDLPLVRSPPADLKLAMAKFDQESRWLCSMYMRRDCSVNNFDRTFAARGKRAPSTARMTTVPHFARCSASHLDVHRASIALASIDRTRSIDARGASAAFA